MARSFEEDSTQYLSSAVISVSYPFTMACWFNCVDTLNNYGLMSIGVTGSQDNRHTLGAYGGVTGNPVRAQSRDTVNAQADSTTGFTEGIWQHACGVWAADNARRAYLNGGNEGTGTGSRTVTGMDSINIGFVQGTTFYMDGIIAEAAIWNGVELSLDEIAALGNRVSPLRIRPAALAAYWPLPGIGSPEPDIIGGYHMTLNGSPVYADHPPVPWGLFAPEWDAFVAAAPAGNPWYAYAQQ